MKYDLNIIADYVSKGLVVGQAHPTLPLAIFNYSRTCQYDRLWDDVTLNCRGLILDTEGNVIAKPFPKFFNYEEHTADEIPNEYFDVYEKMDGSLGICFHYNDEWHMATRGSFTSEQAVKGKEMLDKLNTRFGLIPGYTYLFEIIYPENRIVVDYGGAEKLVVLGCYNNETGIEGSIDEMVNEGFEVVTKYNTFGEGFDELKREISNSKEGYVIRFKSGMRMKIKGDEYVRLHRILTNFSTTDIWELMRTNGNMNEFLDRVPDEFDNWVRMIMMELEAGFENIKFRSSIDFEYYKGESNGDKKEFALAIKDNEYRSILFSMWDGKSYEDAIWKIIKPKWSKPFKKDLDN
jgi:T4 RnlA family RNA ligase